MEEKINLDLEDLSSEPFLDSLINEITGNDLSLVLGVFVGIIVVVITVVLLKFFLGTKKTRSAVLLVGLCDAGKTLLFSRLLTGSFIRTVTSMSESKATYRTKSEKPTSWTLVDIPGHDGLRAQIVDKFKDSARAIVFVVDSAVFQKEVKDVAEFLYFLLTDSVVMKNAPTILIACNKQDITMAKSAKLIQQQLEKELTTLRVTRSAALTSQDGSVRSTAHLGKKGRDFDFSQLPVQVEFVECSARGDEDESAEIEALERSLAQL
ncbi:signal recognition particle receptor subunit beta [Silurus meridionalis]|uniref:Signal recognition particle receptor subunit beta n=1 Tax=Silurus meridionalis TaxID=175797 RepID=A0A8T0AJI7_SILME|nr:signal recognition particle receptor subunit beta [Silurus meridionalis]KAF7692785.1 hypothetical protein HF521_010395 [Silurus meridionalis]KAI5093066.1 signal recognition particle receptor subunit beta [Silurus meridionalis]